MCLFTPKTPSRYLYYVPIDIACWNPSLEGVGFSKAPKNKQASERSEPKQAAKAPNDNIAPALLFLVTLFVQPTWTFQNKTGFLSSKK